MFTGLVRNKAKVIFYKNNTLRLSSNIEVKIGDSIAVNGACLTVVKNEKNFFDLELSLETRKNIATENLKDEVHIEPALRLSDRLDGHFVQGHIDGIGQIVKIQKNDNATDFYIKIPPKLSKFMIPKGSICVDGISLTINEVLQDQIRLTIIPITLKDTLFGVYKANRRVNLESDMMVRNLWYLMTNKQGLTWEKVDQIMSLY